MPDETWNHIEISGAAWGSMSLMTSEHGALPKKLFERPRGQERTFHRIAEPLRGQRIQFTNVEQETPIGELSAYNVDAGKEPDGICTVRYRLTAFRHSADRQLQSLTEFIAGRYLPDERATMVAVPLQSPQSLAEIPHGRLPIVHVLIPADSRAASAALDSSYAWENIDGGLEGIALDIRP